MEITKDNFDTMSYNLQQMARCAEAFCKSMIDLRIVMSTQEKRFIEKIPDPEARQWEMNRERNDFVVEARVALQYLNAILCTLGYEKVEADVFAIAEQWKQLKEE